MPRLEVTGSGFSSTDCGESGDHMGFIVMGVIGVVAFVLGSVITFLLTYRGKKTVTPVLPSEAAEHWADRLRGSEGWANQLKKIIFMIALTPLKKCPKGPEDGVEECNIPAEAPTTASEGAAILEACGIDVPENYEELWDKCVERSQQEAEDRGLLEKVIDRLEEGGKIAGKRARAALKSVVEEREDAPKAKAEKPEAEKPEAKPAESKPAEGEDELSKVKAEAQKAKAEAAAAKAEAQKALANLARFQADHAKDLSKSEAPKAKDEIPVGSFDDKAKRPRRKAKKSEPVTESATVGEPDDGDASDMA